MLIRNVSNFLLSENILKTIIYHVFIIKTDCPFYKKDQCNAEQGSPQSCSCSSDSGFNACFVYRIKNHGLKSVLQENSPNTEISGT
jgi:hypothetical protein